MTWASLNLESGPGFQITFFGSVTAGNLLLVMLTYTGNITSVTDSTGNNTYTLVSGNTTGAPQSALYSSTIVTGGMFTVTANGSLTMPAIIAAEFSFTP